LTQRTLAYYHPATSRHLRLFRGPGWCAPLLTGFLLLLSSVGAQTEDFSGLKERAEAGDAEAQAGLGGIYATGETVAKDLPEAVKWYRRAAKQKNSAGQYGLGWMYYHGRGVSKDRRKASKWFRLAAEQGNAQAQYSLAVMYEKGDGVVKNAERAAKWYRKAAEQGQVGDPDVGVSGLSESEQEIPRPHQKISSGELPGPILRPEGRAPMMGNIQISAKMSEFGEYLARMFDAIGKQFLFLASHFDAVRPPEINTRVVVRYKLTRDGKVKDTTVMDTTAGRVATLIAQDAIESPAPFGTWTAEMIESLREEETVVITFHYR